MAFPSGFAGYDTITPDNPASALTDYFYVVNANALSGTWWANVKSDGGDVHAYNASGTRLPVYLHNWDYGSQAGNIYIQFSGTKSSVSSEDIRIYAGNASEAQPAAGASYGQHAVFQAALKAFYPEGGGNDVTSNAYHLTMTGSPTVGGASGPIAGSKATVFDGATQRGACDVAGAVTDGPLTLLASGVSDVTDATERSMFSLMSTSNNSIHRCTLNIQQLTGVIRGQIAESGTPVNLVTTGTITASTWFSAAATRNSGTGGRSAYRNGGNKGSYGSVEAVTNSPQRWSVGACSRPSSGHTQYWDGALSMLAAHTAILTDDHIAYWHSMLADSDQSDFYTFGGWTSDSAGPPRLLLTNAAYFAGAR